MLAVSTNEYKKNKSISKKIFFVLAKQTIMTC